jgi:hypothetical protein
VGNGSGVGAVNVSGGISDGVGATDWASTSGDQIPSTTLSASTAMDRQTV